MGGFLDNMECLKKDFQLFNNQYLEQEYLLDKLYDGKRLDFERLQSNMIVASFKKFVNHCSLYRQYCINTIGQQRMNDIIENKNILDIPQIPTAVFKSVKVVSDIDNVLMVCNSSGSQGAVSRVYRNMESLFRILSNIDFGINELYGFKPKNVNCFVFGPPVNEAKNIWFSHLISLISLFTTVSYYVKNNNFDIKSLLKDLQNYNEAKRLVLVTPPALLLVFMNYLKNENIFLNLPKDTVIITAGGWKKANNISVSKDELHNLVFKYLGLPENNMFDFFNQVELNSLFMECECKHKHIPVWVKAIIRHPVSLAPLGYEKEGIISYLDPSCTSYPCFLISDDVGILHRDCTCGRTTDYIEIVRRVQTVENKGCAMKIDTLRKNSE